MLHIEMRKAVYGLPQAGILANKKLRHELEPHGYLEHETTPGLWYHKTRPVLFTLVVDDFGVKHVGKEHVDHLILFETKQIQTHQRLDRRLILWNNPGLEL